MAIGGFPNRKDTGETWIINSEERTEVADTWVNAVGSSIRYVWLEAKMVSSDVVLIAHESGIEASPLQRGGQKERNGPVFHLKRSETEASRLSPCARPWPVEAVSAMAEQGLPTCGAV